MAGRQGCTLVRVTWKAVEQAPFQGPGGARASRFHFERLYEV